MSDSEYHVLFGNTLTCNEGRNNLVFDVQSAIKGLFKAP